MNEPHEGELREQRGADNQQPEQACPPPPARMSDEQEQRGKADDIDSRQRTGRDAGAKPLEHLASGEDLGHQAEQPDRQIDAGEDARLRAGDLLSR